MPIEDEKKTIVKMSFLATSKIVPNLFIHKLYGQYLRQVSKP